MLVNSLIYHLKNCTVFHILIPFVFSLVEQSPVQPVFGSDTFEPLLVSSDDNSSESSSNKNNSTIFTPSDKLLLSNISLSRQNSSSSSSLSSSVKIPTTIPTTTTNTDEKKTSSITTSTPTTTTKHYKQRKTSLKLLEQQNANDSGDDNQQQKGKPRHHHKKVRIPRTLSPLQPKPSPTLPVQATSINISSNSKSQDLIQSNKLNISPTSSQITSIASLTNESEFKKSASSNSLVPPSITTKANSSITITNSTKPVKYNNQQQRNFPRSLSKSFSSSSSSSSPPPPLWFNNPVRYIFLNTKNFCFYLRMIVPIVIRNVIIWLYPPLNVIQLLKPINKIHFHPLYIQ